jgi:hypothetical protein
MVIFGCGEGTVEVQLVCASLDTQQESDSWAYLYRMSEVSFRIYLHFELP